MWKSGILLRAARKIHPQPNVNEFKVFHRLCGKDFCTIFVHRKISTFHNRCGKLLKLKIESVKLKIKVLPAAMISKSCAERTPQFSTFHYQLSIFKGKS